MRFRNFEREILWVGDSHRTHPWSLEPGGSTVVVEFLDGKILGYDKVKRPHRYMPKIFREDKRFIFYKNGDNEQYKFLNQYIAKIHAAYQGEDTLDSVWYNGDNELPWDKLESYKTK